ncbi:MAG: hypothetical protein HDT25_09520 [Ruminococcus sp.]|nr:hypothetical protein [Ruminococcus sp.]
MVKEKKAGIKISDKTTYAIIISFFAAFSTFFFIPFDLYIANSTEMLIPEKYVIGAIIAVSAAVFAVSFLILRFTKGTVNFICSSLIFAVTLAFYIQSNFLSLGMEELNGGQYILGAAKVILNALFWAALIFAVFVFHKKNEETYKKVTSYISVAIYIIEIIAISASLVAAQLDSSIPSVTDEEKNNLLQIVCTTEDINTYSTEKNIIMIVADSYDSFAFDNAMETHPETLSEFDGFTYYTNTVGMYSATEEALAHIFTNSERSAVRPYSNDRFFKSMSENYTMNLYSFILDRDICEKYAENCFLADYAPIKEYLYAANVFYRSVMFKAMPEGIKQYFLVTSDDFNEVILADDEYTAYSHDNLDFYNYISEEPVLTEDKQFKLLYINGLHEPRRISAELEETDSKDVGVEETAIAVNKILNSYLHMLKQGDGDVYDNSEILILADHGSGWRLKTEDDRRAYPMLLFKPARAQTSGITVSYAPLSYADLYPTMLKLSGEEPEERTIFDIGEDEQRTRYYGVDGDRVRKTFTENIK